MQKYIFVFNPHTGKLQKIHNEDYLLNLIGQINFKAGVASVANLPTSGNIKYDARIVNDTGNLYIFDGEIWNDQGDIIDVDWSAISNKPSSLVADIDDAVSKKHTQNTDTILDEGGENEISAEQMRELLNVQTSALGIIADIEAKLQYSYTVLHTDTDPDSLNTAIQALEDGEVLEVDSSATYNPISIPANKELIIRPSLGKCINLTGTECIFMFFRLAFNKTSVSISKSEDKS